MPASSHVQPRRRAAPAPALSVAQSSAQPHSTIALPCPSLSPKGMSLRKGSTFHSPTSPPSPSDDPILSIRTIPSRTLTCPKTLEELVAASEKRISDLLESFDRSFSGLTSTVDNDIAHKDVLPVPPFLVAHAASHTELMDVDSNNDHSSKPSAAAAKSRQTTHQHGSDSGLGSSVSTSTFDAHTARSRRSSLSSSSSARSSSGNTSVYSALTTTHEVSTSTKSHQLGEYAIKQIKLHVIDPLLEDSKLQEFHPLVKSLPDRITNRSITCLRDLEKTVIFLAPTKASSPSSYLTFCETSIQCIHTAVDHLNEIDQRRATDRPYTNNYFVDLVEQVRAYARIMALSRQKKAKGKALSDSDYKAGEKLLLKGGIAEDGKPAELVRIKDGQTVPIDAGREEIEVDEEDDETMLDDDVSRSMARKRKCDIGKVEYRACRECGKVYTRPCDLTKHEKTHSRPWKCSDPECKYYDFGWPTEKERDRHVNDKHSSAPAMYKCLYEPCTYQSKRESNCKQHMEKTHGWEYVRSKSKKGEKLVAIQQSPPTNLIPTPASSTAFPRLSTPLTSANESPVTSSLDAFSPESNTSVSVMAGQSVSPMGMGSSYNMSPSDGGPNPFDFSGFDGGLNPTSAFLSPGLTHDRRGSWATSGTGMTPSSSAGFGMAGPTFEDSFNFQELNYNWPTMGEFFPQYNIPVGAQQPTPAWSDFDCDMAITDPAALHPELSPGARPDTMFGSSASFNAGDEGFVDFSSTKPGQAFGAADFELFGPNGESSAAGAAAGSAMFPDLSGGSQFGTDESGSFEELDLENYIYGDER